ncbi:MAG: hypothetical protein N2749_00325 [Clostridia bacterium]|nr:hypothetical protein [Clostridia bacterium]
MSNTSVIDSSCLALNAFDSKEFRKRCDKVYSDRFSAMCPYITIGVLLDLTKYITKILRNGDLFGKITSKELIDISNKFPNSFIYDEIGGILIANPKNKIEPENKWIEYLELDKNKSQAQKIFKLLLEKYFSEYDFDAMRSDLRSRVII